MTLRNRLLEICDVLDVTRQQFAGMVGIAPSAMRAILDGRKQPRPSTIAKIAATCGVASDQLTGSAPFRINFVLVQAGDEKQYFNNAREAIEHFIARRDDRPIEFRYGEAVIE